jgi:hypothetical protein
MIRQLICTYLPLWRHYRPSAAGQRTAQGTCWHDLPRIRFPVVSRPSSEGRIGAHAHVRRATAKAVVPARGCVPFAFVARVGERWGRSARERSVRSGLPLKAPLSGGRGPTNSPSYGPYAGSSRLIEQSRPPPVRAGDLGASVRNGSSRDPTGTLARPSQVREVAGSGPTY